MRKLLICSIVCLSLLLPVSATNDSGTTGDGEVVPDSEVVVDQTEEVVEDGGNDVSSDAPEVVVVSPEDTPVSDPEVSEGDSGLSDILDGDDLSSGVPVVLNSDDPILVTVVESEDDFPTLYGSMRSMELTIEDDPPENPPFYGSLYITGETSSGDVVTLYFPTTYKEGYFGVDSSGRLFNVSATSITGYYSGAYNNSVNVPAFSYPRYRTSSSNYDYTDLYIVPQYSNIDIATGMEGRTTFADLAPYFSLLMLGVIYLCCLKRS